MQKTIVRVPEIIWESTVSGWWSNDLRNYDVWKTSAVLWVSACNCLYGEFNFQIWLID